MIFQYSYFFPFECIHLLLVLHPPTLFFVAHVAHTLRVSYLAATEAKRITSDTECLGGVEIKVVRKHVLMLSKKPIVRDVMGHGGVSPVSRSSSAMYHYISSNSTTPQQMLGNAAMQYNHTKTSKVVNSSQALTHTHKYFVGFAFADLCTFPKVHLTYVHGAFYSK